MAGPGVSPPAMAGRPTREKVGMTAPTLQPAAQGLLNVAYPRLGGSDNETVTAHGRQPRLTLSPLLPPASAASPAAPSPMGSNDQGPEMQMRRAPVAVTPFGTPQAQPVGIYLPRGPTSPRDPTLARGPTPSPGQMTAPVPPSPLVPTPTRPLSLKNCPPSPNEALGPTAAPVTGSARLGASEPVSAAEASEGAACEAEADEATDPAAGGTPGQPRRQAFPSGNRVDDFSLSVIVAIRALARSLLESRVVKPSWTSIFIALEKGVGTPDDPRQCYFVDCGLSAMRRDDARASAERMYAARAAASRGRGHPGSSVDPSSSVPPRTGHRREMPPSADAHADAPARKRARLSNLERAAPRKEALARSASPLSSSATTNALCQADLIQAIAADADRRPPESHDLLGRELRVVTPNMLERFLASTRLSDIRELSYSILVDLFTTAGKLRDSLAAERKSDGWTWEKVVPSELLWDN